MPSNFWRKLISGAGANVYAQCVTILTQLATLPIALSVWDIETYGKWILLSSVPTYLALCELGLLTATSNQVTEAVVQRRWDLARRLLHSGNLLTAITTSAVFVVFALACALSWHTGWLSSQSALAAIILAITMLLTVQAGMIEAAFRGSDMYALGTLLTTSARLLEWLAGIVALQVYPTFVGFASGMLAGRIVAYIFTLAFSWITLPQTRVGLRLATAPLCKQLLRPAATFSVFPLIGVLGNQGITLIVGLHFGNTAVAVFSALRTYTRIAVQLTSLVALPSLSIFSKILATGDHVSLHKKFGLLNTLSIAMTLVGSVTLLSCANPILAFWTKGEIYPDLALLAPLLLTSAAISLYGIPRALLIAAGAHAFFTKTAVAATIILVTGAMVLGDMLGKTWLMYCLFASELAVVLACWHSTRSYFRTTKITCDPHRQ